MPILQTGIAAPWFHAPTHGNPSFSFQSVGGRFVLLVFMPADEGVAARTCRALTENASAFNLDRVVAFGVVRGPKLHRSLAEHVSLRWFLDEAGDVSRRYGALGEAGEHPHWVILDPSLRVAVTGEGLDVGAMLEVVRRLPPVDAHAGTQIHAPVLIVPRIFESALCRRLIGLYEADGGQPSGTMREIDGKTVGVLSDFKKRRDANIVDEDLKALLRQRLATRLLPEIKKAFQFNVTRLERYIVAAYDAIDGGYFHPHRDNTTVGTAHRMFACSINLNAEDHEGGELRFPEFGTRRYRPPTGGAVVFSCSLLHEATPVTKGRRYAFLPFFYDEEGAKIRETNSATIVNPEPEPADA